MTPFTRPLRNDDLDFVIGSWLDSYRDGLLRYLPPRISADAYFPGQRQLITDLLQRPLYQGIAAVTPDYDEAILGWAVAEPPEVLHYVYVKDAFRDMGIARALLGALALAPHFTYTHVTKRAFEVLGDRPGAKFNPYLLRST